jgi:acyl CoA:acetate/3-ketoacid CoA transferase alpha subunit/acyl CoA:acetate/3-ketoacid CoA transferase beta subunit
MNVHIASISPEVTAVAESKIVSLDEAMHRNVRAGDHIHLAYSEARPNAAVLALARRFLNNPDDGPADLTLSSGGLVSSQAALISEGLVSRLIASFVGDNYPSGGPNPLFQQAIDSGDVRLEETTLWTLVARLAAGALGLPYLPVRSLTGSDLARQEWVRTVADTDGGPATTAVAALRPDVTIVHGVAADRSGNVLLSPPYGESAWGALAARRGVIAVVEAILDDEPMRRHQALVGVPSHTVLAVCQAQFGAHPYGLFSPIPEVAGYVEDTAFILAQRRACRSAETQRAWVDEWVRALPDHEAYLAHVGYDHLHRLAGAAVPGSWRLGVDDAPENVEPAGPEELMVLEAARVIYEKATASQVDVLMTGIGFANLAAWLAHRRLTASGHDLPLMAEIGAYGYQPRPGDPFIFSHRNLPTCSWMTGVSEILGSVVSSGNSHSLAVLGAGVVDSEGQTNSSRAADGRFLVGSGGANDIASGAADIVLVIKHGLSRLTQRVPFVTCPGDRVSAIVTTECVLERLPGSDEFLMTRVLLGQHKSLDEAIRDALEGIGWNCHVARDVAAFAPVEESELDRLRSFDPHHAFLPDPAGRRITAGAAS